MLLIQQFLYPSPRNEFRGYRFTSTKSRVAGLDVWGQIHYLILNIMAHTYSSFLYHFVWATKDRAPLIDSQVESVLLDFCPKKVHEQKGYYHICNMVHDHIHLLCELPTTVTISSFIKKIKGASSFILNADTLLNGSFEWQVGYGGFTVSRSDKARVFNYVAKQKIHHADPTFDHPWEKIDLGRWESRYSWEKY